MNIQIGKMPFKTADGWNQLPEGLHYPLYFILKADSLSSIVKLTEAAKFLLNISDDFLEQWRNYVVQEHGLLDGEAIWSEDWSKVVSAVTFPFVEQIEQKDGTLQFQIALDYTRCPYPTLTIPSAKGVRKLFAPGDAFKNITIGEFARIDALFQKYEQKGDTEHVVECLGILYRPHKPNTKENRRAKYHGDVRLKLKEAEHTIQERAALFEKGVTPQGLQLLWFWVASCREQILRKWSSVLNPSVSGQKTYWHEQLAKFGWAGVFIELANGGLTEEMVADTPYEDVMMKLAYFETKRKAEKK